jgi:FkbM family methyltransferase
MISILDLEINNILDIGAHVGKFSLDINKIFPNAYVLMIEANKKCEDYLKLIGFDYAIALLSNTNKLVDFYINPNDQISTGNSYLLENTGYFEKFLTEQIYSVTLDQVSEVVNKNFDLIKIDTQGSELDILKGGIKTIKNSKCIIVEASTIKEKPYNKGAPHCDEIIEFMKDHGYGRYSIVGEHAWWLNDPNFSKYSYGEIFQKDFMFFSDSL